MKEIIRNSSSVVSLLHRQIHPEAAAAIFAFLSSFHDKKNNLYLVVWSCWKYLKRSIMFYLWKECVLFRRLLRYFCSQFIIKSCSLFKIQNSKLVTFILELGRKRLLYFKLATQIIFARMRCKKFSRKTFFFVIQAQIIGILTLTLIKKKLIRDWH